MKKGSTLFVLPVSVSRSDYLRLLFADGHVKALHPDATLTPTNLWTRNNAAFAGQNLLNAQAIVAHAEGE